MSRYLSHESKEARLDNEPLWLVVDRDGKSKSYEFPPADDDTTVVVGSSERAQIRIAGAAPIAFYVERIKNVLCITSCYLGSDLCVDGHVVSGRCTIVRCATLELAGVRLVLSVRDNPPTLPGYYVDAISGDPSEPCSVSREQPPNGVSQTDLIASARPVVPTTIPKPSANCDNRGPPAPSGSSVESPDANSAAFDTWFDATFPGAAEARAKSKGPNEPSAVRCKPVQLKRVTVPPRPRETSRRPDTDFSPTQEFAPLRLMASAEELDTIELGPASSSSEFPTQPAIRIGATTTASKVGPEPVLGQPTKGMKSTTPLLPIIPRRKRHPLLFLLGAAIGTVLPALCLVGVGRLAVLSKSEAGARTHSTNATTTAATNSTVPSGVSTVASASSLPSAAALLTSAPSANRVPIQPPRLNKRHVRPAASTH